MSRYIKLEDAIKAITDSCKDRCLDCEFYWNDECAINDILSDLPTIEVSEDAISKAYLEQEIENQTMTVKKDEEYWRGWNNALGKVVELIEDAPSVVPTVRKNRTVEQSCNTCRHNKLKWNSEECFWCTKTNSNYEPTTEQSSKVGEWENYKDEHRCSECGEVVIGDWYDDEWYDYCPNCGADMRGGKDD